MVMVEVVRPDLFWRG